MIAIAVTVGMFSKESAIVAVAVIALYDFTFGAHVSWRLRVPSYIAVTVPCLVFVFVRAQVLAQAAATQFLFAENPLIVAGFWTARMTAIKVIGRYLALLFWPARLSFDYSYNEIPLFGWRIDKLGRRKGRRRPDRLLRRRRRGHPFFPAKQACLLFHRVLLRYPVTHFEPYHSDRQHYGRTVFFSRPLGLWRLWSVLFSRSRGIFGHTATQGWRL